MRSVKGVITRRRPFPRYSLPYVNTASATVTTAVLPCGAHEHGHTHSTLPPRASAPGNALEWGTRSREVGGWMCSRGCLVTGAPGGGDGNHAQVHGSSTCAHEQPLSSQKSHTDLQALLQL
jgi:hypothetical protein